MEITGTRIRIFLNTKRKIFLNIEDPPNGEIVNIIP